MCRFLAQPSVAVFDCDGVILQSNRLKSDAFGDVLNSQGHDPALVAAFVAWHKSTGGVSRFHKFARFFRDTLELHDWKARTEEACEAFGTITSQGLRTCPTVPGLGALLTAWKTRGVPMSINTGGAQDEVRKVLRARGLDASFEVILGSPSTKHDNMLTLRDMGLIQPGGVYLGDSKLDWELATEFDLHFIYVAHESEWTDGAQVTQETSGTIVADLTEIGRPEVG